MWALWDIGAKGETVEGYVIVLLGESSVKSPEVLKRMVIQLEHLQSESSKFYIPQNNRGLEREKPRCRCARWKQLFHSFWKDQQNWRSEELEATATTTTTTDRG